MKKMLESILNNGSFYVLACNNSDHVSAGLLERAGCQIKLRTCCQSKVIIENSTLNILAV